MKSNQPSLHETQGGSGNTTTYVYDERGQMTSLTNALGDTVHHAHDALGRKISETEYGTAPWVTKISWTHDAAGRILTRTADAATTTYTYDDNGNQLAAASTAGTITTTYDRLNRPLTVGVSGDSGAATSYTYSLTSPSWTDASGSFTATLDAFDRQVSLTDPIHGTDFTWAYRADGQPASMSAPNGNTTAYGYDDAGAPISKTTTGTGGAARAAYTWTRNQAGQTLSEASTISGDPSNGTATFGYDQLGRLTGYTPPSGTTTAYGWEKVPNRDSVQVGANPAVTTSFDAANRPTSDSGGGSYAHDVEGRLTARPGQTMVWDALGRLTSVKNAAGTVTLATYTYDALDRLHTVDDGTTVVRFRYVGRTTSVAETVNDGTGSGIRSIANDWTGQRLVDWTGTNSNQRFYGTNAHHDVTWTADDTGAVTNRLRYDPWGTAISTSGSSLPDFRFQGSWYHPTTDLSWVVTRWYAPALGRFVSEDALLGTLPEPGSRHLYAYAIGNPILGWDPDGRSCYRIWSGDRKRSSPVTAYGGIARWWSTVTYRVGWSSCNLQGPGNWLRVIRFTTALKVISIGWHGEKVHVDTEAAVIRLHGEDIWWDTMTTRYWIDKVPRRYEGLVTMRRDHKPRNLVIPYHKNVAIRHTAVLNSRVNAVLVYKWIAHVVLKNA